MRKDPPKNAAAFHANMSCQESQDLVMKTDNYFCSWKLMQYTISLRDLFVMYSSKISNKKIGVKPLADNNEIF